MDGCWGLLEELASLVGWSLMYHYAKAHVSVMSIKAFINLYLIQVRCYQVQTLETWIGLVIFGNHLKSFKMQSNFTSLYLNKDMNRLFLQSWLFQFSFRGVIFQISSLILSKKHILCKITMIFNMVSKLGFSPSPFFCLYSYFLIYFEPL